MGINALGNFQLNTAKFNTLQENLTSKISEQTTQALASLKTELRDESAGRLKRVDSQIQVLFRGQKEIELKPVIEELTGLSGFRHLPSDFSDLIDLAKKDNSLVEELNSTFLLRQSLEYIRLFLTKHNIDQDAKVELSSFLNTLNRDDLLSLIQEIRIQAKIE